MKDTENFDGKVIAIKDGTVVLTKEYYQDLIEQSILLDCLECWGVDCWSGYSDAYADYQAAINEDDE